MTGHDEIRAMRRAGFKPDFVWISDFANCTMDGKTVRVCNDVPELLDLRFLVGITAIVEGDNPVRVDRIAKACSAQAARVIASTHAFDGPYRRVVTSITDTQGTMTWPKA